MLFVIPWDLHWAGGVNQVVENLLRQAERALPQRSSVLITEYDAAAPRFGELPLARTVHLRILAPWLPGMRLRYLLTFAVRWPRNVWTLARVLREIGPRSINVHFPGLWCMTLALARRFVRPLPPLVLSFHGTDVRQVEQSRPLLRFFWRRMLRKADLVTCVSQHSHDRLINAIGGPLPNLAVVPNGIDTEHLADELTHGRVPAELAGRRYIVNVGTFDDVKGQDVLVRAFATLRLQRPDITLAIVGRTGPMLVKLRGLIDELRLGEAVVLLADCSHADTLAIMRGAAAFVLSSRMESFGLVLLEAAYCETPIVATSVGGVAEVVADRESALLVPPENPQALSDSVMSVLDDADLRARLVTNARARLEQFSWRASFDRLNSLIMRALAPGSS